MVRPGLKISAASYGRASEMLLTTLDVSAAVETQEQASARIAHAQVYATLAVAAAILETGKQK